jgi:hypothetical protein
LVTRIFGPNRDYLVERKDSNEAVEWEFVLHPVDCEIKASHVRRQRSLDKVLEEMKSRLRHAGSHRSAFVSEASTEFGNQCRALKHALSV